MDFKNKFLIWMFLMVLLSGFVNAALNDAIVYYSFDSGEEFTNIANESQYNLTNVGTTSGTGVLGEARISDGSANYLTSTYDIGVGNTGRAYTYSAWINGTSSCAECWIMGSDNYGPDNTIQITANDIEARTMGGTKLASGVTSLGTLHHVLLRYDGSKGRLWIDDVDKGAVNPGGTDRGDKFIIGALRDSDGYGSFIGMIDEVAVWARNITDAEKTQLYNNGLGYNPYAAQTNFSITAQDIITTTPIINFSATINGTFYTSNESGTIITSILKSEISLINITNIYGFNYSATNLSDINISTDYVANLRKYFYSSANFTDVALELSDVPLQLIINTSNAITGTSAELTYNNSAQLVSKTIFSDYVLFESIITTPKISGNTTVLFNWNYTINRINDSVNESIIGNHTVISIGIDNCSTYTTRAINFSVVREDNVTIIPNANLAGHFTLNTGLPTAFKEFNLTWTPIPSSSYGICIDPTTATYFTNAQFEYSATGLSEKTYYFDNATLNNVTNHINLFLVNGTTDVTFKVLDTNNKPVSNVFIYVQKYDLPTDSAETVEILNTDNDGQAIGRIRLVEQWYKFLLVKDGVNVFTASPQKILTTPHTFTINLDTDYISTFDESRDVVCSLDYDDTSKIFTFVFTDVSGNVNQGCLNIIRRDTYSDKVVNNSCLSTSSGTINLGIPNTNNTYLANANVYIDGNLFMCATSSADLSSNWQVYGSEGLFASFLVVTTLIGIGLWSPMAAVFLGTISFVIMSVLGMFHFGWEYLIVLIILGGTVLYKLNITRR